MTNLFDIQLHLPTCRSRLRLPTLLVLCFFNIFSVSAISLPVDTLSVPAPVDVSAFPDSMTIAPVIDRHDRVLISGDSIIVEPDSVIEIPEGMVPVDIGALPDSLAAPAYKGDPDMRVRDFNPDPTRAMWMSALCPGLGQLYNRRYWKLPIVVGAYAGLGYATSWNNRMLNDYTQAYRDLTDNDPTTKSYMNFYPPGTDESKLNRTWLEKTLKSKKDFFRRNRDLCIICMIGVYFVAMVDAYVDASLAHFDISDDLSLDIHPTVIPTNRPTQPGIGVQWALNF